MTETLADYVELKGRRVWEPACGDGRMAEALKRAGAQVYASDIEDCGYAGLNERLDFTSLQRPKIALLEPRIITNPPYAYPGERSHRLATGFIAAGLHHIRRGGRGLLALLLPIGFEFPSDTVPSVRRLSRFRRQDRADRTHRLVRAR